VTAYFVGHGIFDFSGCYCKKFCAYELARTGFTLVTPTYNRRKLQGACDCVLISVTVNGNVCMCVGKCRVLLINLIPSPTRGRR